ncbi:hypothetical protein [Alteromonas macleodii]|nr:hypothetical protein [Alteromonas macleodii]
MSLKYLVEWSIMNDAVWIHASDGSTVGRFGRMGVDLHNTVTDQMNGAPECRLCTHGKPTTEQWQLFRDKALEWWGVDVPNDAFSNQLLM